MAGRQHYVGQRSEETSQRKYTKPAGYYCAYMGCKVKQVEAKGSRKQRKQLGRHRVRREDKRKTKELREVTELKKKKQESTWTKNTSNKLAKRCEQP